MVDDEESILSLGRIMLERLGFDVLCAHDGQEALDIYRSHPGKIVCTLLDLTMPKMDGREAFRQIKLEDPDARIILCSGYNEYEATAHFTGKGLSGFINKPYELTMLRNQLRAVLSL